MVAEAAGAVGLVVLNNEPGGHVFAMTGHAESEGELSGVTIPVIMVSYLSWSIARKPVRECTPPKSRGDTKGDISRKTIGQMLPR